MYSSNNQLRIIDGINALSKMMLMSSLTSLIIFVHILPIPIVISLLSGMVMIFVLLSHNTNANIGIVISNVPNIVDDSDVKVPNDIDDSDNNPNDSDNNPNDSDNNAEESVPDIKVPDTVVNTVDEYDQKYKIVSKGFCKNTVQTPDGKLQYLFQFNMTGFAVDLLKFTYDSNSILRALLVKRAKNTLPEVFAGLYAIPGGFLNYGNENDLGAAVRETKEETGTDTDTNTTTTKNPIYRLTVASDPSRDPRQHTISSVFFKVVEMDSKPLFTNDEEEIAGVQWVPLDKILCDDFVMAFDHKKLIKRAYDLHVYIKSLPYNERKAVMNVLQQQL